jgi:hypothetical protein
MNMTDMILTGKTRAGLCAACSQTLRLAACSWLLTKIQQYDIWHLPLATASNIIGATRLWTNFSYLKNTGAMGSAARCLCMQKRLPKDKESEPSISKSRDTMNPSCAFTIVNDSKIMTGTWRPSVCKVF